MRMRFAPGCTGIFAVGTDMQNFDLFDVDGGSTAADMHATPLDSLSVGAIVRRVVERHDGCALDDKDDRETLIAALIAALIGG
jgi:hypothetical protein